MSEHAGAFSPDEIAQSVADLGLPAAGVLDDEGNTVPWDAPAADLLGPEALDEDDDGNYTVFEALVDQAGADGLSLDELVELGGVALPQDG